MGFIDKIQAGGVDYDIAATSLGTKVSGYSFTSAGTYIEGIDIYNANVEQKEGKVSGYDALVTLNQKGNLSLESPKHINLEPGQGVQFKPITTMIIDTGNRIEKNGMDNDFNESIWEVKFDDYSKLPTEEKTKYDEYGYLKMKARAIDLRCLKHGGIALQIAGKDSAGHENKLKFESDRTSNINEGGTYNGEGGKGLEFGTINNLHTSIYTKDYRFNNEAKVYAVKRVISATTDKVDYQTQKDDFKDILLDSGQTPCVCDGTNWTNAYGASWWEIVNVARKYADGKIGGGSGSGSPIDPDIYATKTWVEEKGYITVSGLPVALKQIRITENGNLEITSSGLTDASLNPSNLNLESDNKVKVSAQNDVEINAKGAENDIILDATNNVIINAGKVKLWGVGGEESAKTAMVEAEKGILMGETPSIKFMTAKISAKAKLTEITSMLEIGMFNNFANTTYYDGVNKKVHVPMDFTVFYTDASATTLYKPTTSSSKTYVYYADGTQPNDGEVHFVKNEDLNDVFIVEINKDKQAKKEPKSYSTTEGYENVVLESISYVPDPTFTTVPAGEYVVTDSVKVSDIIELVKHKDALLALLNN